jgi:hypothetical protein
MGATAPTAVLTPPWSIVPSSLEVRLAHMLMVNGMVMHIRDEVVWYAISLERKTYSLGFFFGPGLPRGLGRLSEPRPSPLFDPGLGPFVLIFFGVSSVVG